MEGFDILSAVDSGATLVFAVIVWRELFTLRTALTGHLQEVAERLAAIETATGLRDS